MSDVATGGSRAVAPHKQVMPISFRHRRTVAQTLAVAWVALLATVVSCGSDRSAGPNTTDAATDSTTPPDSVPVSPDSISPPDSAPPPEPPPEPPPQEPPPPEPPPDTPPPDSGPPIVPVHIGLPFGPQELLRDSARLRWGPGPFTGSFNFSDPEWLVEDLELARRSNLRLVVAMTGGRHERYKTNDKFDLAKWKARQDQYDTPEIRAAVARAVEDGTIILNSMMDEPNVESWGGVMTKALLDEMATYVKRTFPTLPVGVALRYDWLPEERFRVLDAIITQFRWNKGSVTRYRDEALAVAQQSGMAVVFALNIIDGGEYKWSTRACPIPLTGGHGSYSPACKMTPDQIREWGMTLGPAGCGLMMWRFEQDFVTQPANMQAFKDIAEKLAKIPARPCRRL